MTQRIGEATAVCCYTYEEAHASDCKLIAQRDALRAALAKYRYEDCPECMVRAEMLADVTPMSPGSANMIVRPTGHKITHDETCSIGRLMPSGGDNR